MTFVNDTNELRKVYCSLLTESAKTDSRIVVVESDLMNANGTGGFKKAYPERTFDVGIAEANMMCVAAGLASTGKLPFANTFTPFATRRCFDQLTISVAYTGLPVRIGGTDPGITAEVNGGTHMSVEDVAIVRAVPNMTIFEPCDETQLRAAWPWILEYNGPIYIRINRKACVKVFNDDYKFEPGKVSVISEGTDAVIFTSGIMVSRSMQAAEALAAEGISAAVVNVHTVKPLDKDGILYWAKKCGAVVTAENGSVVGALGGAVSEFLAENRPTPVKMIGLRDHFGEVGNLAFLSEKFHMNPPDIASAAKAAIAMK